MLQFWKSAENELSTIFDESLAASPELRVKVKLFQLGQLIHRQQFLLELI